MLVQNRISRKYTEPVENKRKYLIWKVYSGGKPKLNLKKKKKNISHWKKIIKFYDFFKAKMPRISQKLCLV